MFRPRHRRLALVEARVLWSVVHPCNEHYDRPEGGERSITAPWKDSDNIVSNRLNEVEQPHARGHTEFAQPVRDPGLPALLPLGSTGVGEALGRPRRVAAAG